ncbi:MAG: hypothetical protein ACXWNC_03180 [Anaerolineales bacterium]
MDSPNIKKTGLFRSVFAGNFIDLQGLPVTLKILVLVGYLAVLGQLLFTLLVELAGDRLSVVLYSIAENNYRVPLLVMSVAGLAFILGWAYLLAGAAAAKARVFLPVLALFSLQLFLVTGGNLLLVFLELVFFLAVLVIYGLTFRTNFWSDLPGLHFFGWLAAVSILVFFSVGLSATNSKVATALSANFSILQLLTFVFWVLLGLSVIDLGVSIGRWFNRVARKTFPFSAFSALIIFTLLVHPVVIALVFWLTRDGFWLLDVIFSILLILGAGIVWIAHRWSPHTGSVFLILCFATPVVVLGLSMAFAGNDFTQILLSMTGIFPPTLLFVGLTTYNLFGMGTSFTSVDGRILPKRARIMLYFGTLLLVVACMLFRSNDHIVGTNQLSLDIQSWINNLFALSALFIGLPYVVWMVWKRRELLIGPESDFFAPPRWGWLTRISGQVWVALAVLIACACSCALAAILYSLI